uniref:Uncharacterized protein n=1 Tax=Plectus sambesii TaxID=2011161 RepID=A0A914V9S0_9BILA
MLICCTADGLHNEASASREHVLLKITSSDDEDLPKNIYQTADIIVQQSSTEIGLTALGFFKLSKGALLTIYSLVITYVIILLQSVQGPGVGKLLKNATELN